MTDTTNWNLQNAQRSLMARRPTNGTKSIADITADYRPGDIWEKEPPAQSEQRAYVLTSLDALRYDHLNQQQAGRLRHAVDRARKWLADYGRTPGLSFVLSGPVGTGKTTIAENLMQAFQRTTRIGSDDDDDRYRDLLRSAMAKMAKDSPLRADLERMLENHAGGDSQTVQVLDARMVEATELMRIMGDEETNLDRAFGRYKAIIIDDAGTEEIDYGDVEAKRHKRYGRLLDYCYRSNKHVIITSMRQRMLLPDGNFDPDFINIFGGKAFSRIYQMSAGYMVDLSGLPDYRIHLARKS